MNDLEKIIRLLNLTNSDNDNEALSAIRMANKILAKEKKLWEDLLGKSVQKKEYRWKEMPTFFSSAHFKAIMECKEFTSLLSQGQVDSLNTFVRFYNQHKYLPQKHWTDLRDLWNDFRERHR